MGHKAHLAAREAWLWSSSLNSQNMIKVRRTLRSSGVCHRVIQVGIPLRSRWGKGHLFFSACVDNLREISLLKNCCAVADSLYPPCPEPLSLNQLTSTGRCKAMGISQVQDSVLRLLEDYIWAPAVIKHCL